VRVIHPSHPSHTTPCHRALQVEGMKRGYQERLDAERDATLKFKGENGIMAKKFAALTKESDEVGEEIKRMGDKQKGLRAQITVSGTRWAGAGAGGGGGASGGGVAITPPVSAAGVLPACGTCGTSPP
jgi:hypothetical protein